MLADSKTRSIALDQESRDSARLGGRIGADRDNVNSAELAVSDEGFCAVNDPFVAMLHADRFRAAGIRSGIRLGESERAEPFAGAKLRQIFFLLLLWFRDRKWDRNQATYARQA